jgi:hypothetical protein
MHTGSDIEKEEGGRVAVFTRNNVSTRVHSDRRATFVRFSSHSFCVCVCVYLFALQK